MIRPNFVPSGEDGIRTREGGLGPLTGLANRRYRPLSHLSGSQGEDAPMPLAIIVSGTERVQGGSSVNRDNALSARGYNHCRLVLQRHFPRVFETDEDAPQVRGEALGLFSFAGSVGSRERPS